MRSDVDVGGIDESGVSIFHRAWSHSEKKKGTLDLVLESLLFYTSGITIIAMSEDTASITIVHIVEPLLMLLEVYH